MFQDSFDVMEHGQAAKILDSLNPLIAGTPYDSAQSRVLKHSLSFYPGYDLVEVSDYEVNPPRTNSFIYAQNKDAVLLDGTNEPIYALNKSVPLVITQDNIHLYVRFFFNYVQGRFGRFLIVENVEEVNWKEEPSIAGKKALSKMIHGLDLKSFNDDEFILNASIVFKDSLFEADIHVKADGQVNLSRQELSVEDIPVFDDRFHQ